MALFSLALIAIQMANYHVPVPATIPTSQGSTNLLLRVLMAEDQIPFEATQTVIFPVGESSQGTVTRERHYGQNRSRIEYATPKALSGKLVVNDGHWQWEYDPSTNRAIRSESKWRPMTLALASRMEQRVLKSYSVSIDPQFANISGRDAYVLRLNPKGNDRHRQVWWIDKTTALVMRREVFDSLNRLHSTSSFSSVRILAPAHTKGPVWHRPSGSTVITRNDPAPIKSHIDARRAVPGWMRVSRTLGHGFEFDCARLVKVNEIQTAHLLYSDGIIGISLIQIPEKATVPAGDVPSKPIQIGTVKGEITHQSRFSVLSWRSDGSTFSLVADLPESTLVAIARSLL